MKQEEIWLVNLDPTIGAEIRKTRPCVILNDDAIGILPLKIIAPITDFKPKYKIVPWMVRLRKSPTNGLDKDSVIDVFQVRSLSNQRLIKKLGKIEKSELKSAHDAMRVVIGI